MKAGMLLATLVAFAIGLALGWSRPRFVNPAAERAVKVLPTIPAGKASPDSSPDLAEAPREVPELTATPIEAPPQSPRKRLFRRLIDGWPIATRHSFLWSLLVGNRKLQAELLGFLLASRDRAVWEAGKDLLISNNEPEFVQRLIAAFGTEADEGRLQMIAHALGGNARTLPARLLVEQILSGTNPAVTHSVLVRLNMESLRDRSDSSLRIEVRLRDLVQGGMTPEIRSQAVLSLRGGSSEDQTRFLMGVIQAHAEPQVRRNAIRSLSVTYSSPALLENEQISLLWSVARNESENPEVRKAAARVLRNSSRSGVMAPRDVDLELIKKLTEP